MAVGSLLHPKSKSKELGLLGQEPNRRECIRPDKLWLEGKERRSEMGLGRSSGERAGERVLSVGSTASRAPWPPPSAEPSLAAFPTSLATMLPKQEAASITGREGFASDKAETQP